MNSAADDNQLTQFSSAVGLGKQVEIEAASIFFSQVLFAFVLTPSLLGPEDFSRPHSACHMPGPENVQAVGKRTFGFVVEEKDSCRHTYGS